MFDCNWFCERIEAYIDNELTGTDSDNFNAHKDLCSSCREELEFSISLRKKLKSLDLPKLPVDFRENLNKRLDMELSDESEIKPVIKKRLFNKRVYSSLAACLLIAAFLEVNNSGNLTDNISPTKSPITDNQLTFSATIPQIEESIEINTVIPTKEPAKPTKAPSKTATEETKDPGSKKRLTAPKVAPEEIKEDSASNENSGVQVASVTQEQIENQSAPEDEISVNEASKTHNNVGILRVEEEKIDELLPVIQKYAVLDNGVYTMTADQYFELVETIESMNIQYETNAPVSDDVKLTIESL